MSAKQKFNIFEKKCVNETDPNISGSETLCDIFNPVPSMSVAAWTAAITSGDKTSTGSSVSSSLND